MRSVVSWRASAQAHTRVEAQIKTRGRREKGAAFFSSSALSFSLSLSPFGIPPRFAALFVAHSSLHSSSQTNSQHNPQQIQRMTAPARRTVSIANAKVNSAKRREKSERASTRLLSEEREQESKSNSRVSRANSKARLFRLWGRARDKIKGCSFRGNNGQKAPCLSASEAMKEDAKKTRLDTSRDEPTATTTAERAISPLFFLSRLPSPVPLESPSVSHRPTARAPSLSAPRSAPSSSASPPTLVREIDQEEFSGKGEPPTTKRWLSSFSPFISLFRSPFSFHLPYESHLRLRQVYLHAPHDRRLRRRPPAPGR